VSRWGLRNLSDLEDEDERLGWVGL